MEEKSTYQFCSLAELKSKKKVTRYIEALRDEVSVFWMNGKPKAISSVCPHFGGEFDYDPGKEMLRCRWHGWKFDLHSCLSLSQWNMYEEGSLVGKILKEANEPLGCFPFKGKLHTYDMNLKGDVVEIIFPVANQ